MQTLCDSREGSHSTCQLTCRLLPTIASVLDRVCVLNAHKPQTNPFAGIAAAPISIVDYILRIHHFVGCSDECFVVGLIYIDRLLFRRPTIVMNTLTAHRLVLTAVLLAAKFYDDSVFNNKYFARIGGLATSEMNVLEFEFLSGIDFNLVVEYEASGVEGNYSEYVKQLTGVSAGNVSLSPILPLQEEQSSTPLHNQHKKSSQPEGQKKKRLEIALCAQESRVGLCGREHPPLLHSVPRAAELCG